MASPTHFDDDFDFLGGFGARHSGTKRSSPDYDDEDYDNDPYATKKAKSKAEEASGVTTGMILSLRESLQNCKDTLVTCQSELEAAKTEIQSWHSTLKNEPSVPAGVTPDPKMLINHLQTLKTSEESLREQLEKAKKKEAAFIVTFAKREQEITELKCPSFLIFDVLSLIDLVICLDLGYSSTRDGTFCCVGSESATQATVYAVDQQDPPFGMEQEDPTLTWRRMKWRQPWWHGRLRGLRTARDKWEEAVWLLGFVDCVLGIGWRRAIISELVEGAEASNGDDEPWGLLLAKPGYTRSMSLLIQLEARPFAPSVPGWTALSGWSELAWLVAALCLWCLCLYHLTSLLKINPAAEIAHHARRLLLDPAVHEEFTRLKNLVEEKDKKVKELQDNIAAMNFTPQSKMGKMLMAKCRTLQEENEEIGNQASEGKIHELGMKLALQKTQNSQLRSQFEGLQKHMEGLTNDVERSNETVLMLQDKLEEKDREIQRLKHELQQKNVEDARSDAALTRNDNNETTAGEAAN
ncbi:hypothetical protein V8G54_005679 [Vigna mungo]|uniref:FKBP12-interacting protein of 37 kDa n=1 Tax=Vigna mungo TaxID=3915 RepID=A0AAQ3P0I3_VIGMU